MNQFKKRLDALEQAEQAQPARLRRFTADLVFTYATDEERAEWEAAGRPVATWAEWEATVDRVYGNS